MPEIPVWFTIALILAVLAEVFLLTNWYASRRRDARWRARYLRRTYRKCRR